MEQIIEKLSEIETAASRIMESAAEEKRLMDQQQEERLAACDAEIEAATQKKLMDEIYSRDHDRITDEIYHNIIRK